jgi:hypothetical protein
MIYKFSSHFSTNLMPLALKVPWRSLRFLLLILLPTRRWLILLLILIVLLPLLLLFLLLWLIGDLHLDHLLYFFDCYIFNLSLPCRQTGHLFDFIRRSSAQELHMERCLQGINIMFAKSVKHTMHSFSLPPYMSLITNACPFCYWRSYKLPSQTILPQP